MFRLVVAQRAYTKSRVTVRLDIMNGKNGEDKALSIRHALLGGTYKQMC